MKTDQEQTTLIQLIRPTFARDYVIAQGWRRKTTKSSEYALFEHPKIDLIQLLIPQNHQSSDYFERILEAAEKLSHVEGRSLTPILRNMLHPNADCLHFKYSSEGTKTGGISLLNGVGFLAGIRRILEAAACGVADPQPFFKRLQRTEAKQFLNSCLLEQTGFGSYEINVTCPLETMPEVSTSQPFLLPGAVIAPFERQVTEYIVDASSQIAASIEKDAINELVDKMGKANEQPSSRPFPLINANFCDAILDVHAADDAGDLILSASWSPRHPRDKSAPNHICFRPEYAEKIDQISRQLKPLKTEQEPVSVIASVEILRGDISSAGEREGYVDLRVFDKESGELVLASVYLNAADYVTADKAHMQGEYVKVRGTLRRGRRKHTITNVEFFGIEE
jgi:hypothetical protein